MPSMILQLLLACGGQGDSGRPGECPGAHDPGLPVRTGAEVCTTDRVASWPEWGHCPPEAECQEHADCTAGPSGRCKWQGAGDCGCEYDQCITDADCAPGRTCMCGEDPVITGWAVNTCVPAECRGPADCPEGETCVVARIGDYCFEGFPPSHNSPSCTQPADRCRSHEACACTGAGDVCSSDGQALGCREIQQITCE